jgi:sugar lactone lactonase YvrE
MTRARLLAACLVPALLLGAGGAAGRTTISAPARATAGLPLTVVVRVTPAPRPGSVSLLASTAGRRLVLSLTGAGQRYSAHVALPSAGLWTLSVRVGGRQQASRKVRVAAPALRLPFSMAVAGGAVYVGDAGTHRILRLDTATGRLRVHATGVEEPTGLAAAGNVLYVADFHPGLVRRIAPTGRVTTLARLAQVTSVATSRDGAVYAVTMDGTLARISSTGAITRVVAGLDRPHGVAVDRDGSLLVAEDSRRVRRVDPGSGRITPIVDGVDTNKIAVAADGTLYLAGSTRTGGSLRRLEPGGPPVTLFDGVHVSDVATLAGGMLVATAVEPAAVFRVDPRTGARTRLAG